MRRKEVTNIFENAGIAKRWWQYSIDEVVGYENLKSFDYTQKGIILQGINGIGKTMFMNCYFMALIEKTLEGKGGVKLFITSLHDLIELYITRNKNSKYHELLGYDLVGIDDVGDSYLGGGARELSSVVLNHFLRKRFDNCLHTWLTTNIQSTEKVEEFFGRRFTSFLQESCVFCLVVASTDVRNDLKEEICVNLDSALKKHRKQK